MFPAQIFQAAMTTGILLCADLQTLTLANETGSEYFEGRWAFAEETCDAPSNWTLLAGGNFISEDLTGRWEYLEGRLVLHLTDLAADEETGEVGEKFEMEGPVERVSADKFIMTVTPDQYEMKRCR